MAPRCIVRGCVNSTRHDKNYSYFSLPQNADIRQEWLRFAEPDEKALNVKQPRICGLHFTEENLSKMRGPKNARSRVVKHATPTRNKPIPELVEFEPVLENLPTWSAVPTMKMDLVAKPSEERKFLRTSQGKKEMKKRRKAALHAIGRFRDLLVADKYRSDNPSIFDAGKVDIKGFDDHVLFAEMQNLPKYDPDLFVRHPLVGKTVEIANKATELLGLGLLEEKDMRWEQAEALYDTVTASCEAARDLALSSLTPLLHTKVSCQSGASDCAIKADASINKLVPLSDTATYLGKTTDLMIMLNSANAACSNVVKESIDHAMKEVNKIVASPNLKPYPSCDNLTPYQIIQYDEYLLMYDNRFKIPVYTWERLTPASLKKDPKVKRKDKFFEDDHVFPLFRSTSWDYKGSDLDKGHLVAAANHVMTQAANDVSFTMANMAPQAQRLNRITWRKAETFIRKKALLSEECILINGPAFKAKGEGKDRHFEMKAIGENDVLVPPYFFKAAAIKGKDGVYHFWGWIMPNREDISKDHTPYHATLDEVRSVCGLVLFEDIKFELENGNVPEIASPKKKQKTRR